MSRPTEYDFSGYATRNDRLCADGRVIRQNAFVDNDGGTVPLVYQHDHNNPDNVLGHAFLENREDGVYAYGKFNDGPTARQVKRLIGNGDINALSIHATNLKQRGAEVLHGIIREVSVVMSGANPGAFIQDIAFAHSDDEVGEAVIYTGDTLLHSASNNPTEKEAHVADIEDEPTLEEVIDSMTEEQREAMYAVVGAVLDDEEDDYDDDDDDDYDYDDDEELEQSAMSHNIFEGEDVLTHSGGVPDIDFSEIMHDAMRGGMLSDTVLAHAAGYGISNIDLLFPDAHNLDAIPRLVQRKKEWVGSVLNGASHSPFSRIKTQSADITDEKLRAKGYKKGVKKSEADFAVAFRTTTPKTVYVKQKLDRDDIIDVTSFDVVSWIKSIMRGQLDEELARAALIGDGRLPSAEEKIDEDKIRPIWTDADLYSVKVDVTTGGTVAVTPRVLEEQIQTAYEHYEGSGTPTLFCPRSTYNMLMMQRDANGRRIYNTRAELAAVLEVKDIVVVDVMKGQQRTDTQKSKTYDLLGIIVNMSDYTFGADKGGQTSFFDDFDIDFNQFKYLFEGRCSGALTSLKSALVIEADTAAPKAATGDPIVRTKAAE